MEIRIIDGSKDVIIRKLAKIVFPVLSLLFFVSIFMNVFDIYDLTYSAAGYNILLILPLFGMILMMVRCLWVTVLVSSLIMFVLYYMDQFIYSVRLTHIRFSDFFLVKQAMGVAGRYTPIWNGELTVKLLWALGLCLLLWVISRYYKLEYRKKYLFCAGVAEVIFTVILIAGLSAGGVLPTYSEDFDFTSNTEDNGLLYSWYCQYRQSKVTKPDGYSDEKVQEILKKYEVQGNEEKKEDSVNLIVIMNESFADYSLSGEPVFDDPLTNIDNYKDHFFEGKLAVSIFGGMTCNTEYEFLTGNVLAFMPADATPYLQYVVGPQNSIVSDLGELKYSRTAIHPYYAEEWNRTQVYEFLGFDQFISGADFGTEVEIKGKKATSRPSENLISFGEGPLYVRGLISDHSCFEKILDIQENKEKNFQFAVTMQNHGSYLYKGEDFDNTVYVTAEDKVEKNEQNSKLDRLFQIDGASDEDELYETNQYLTCVNLSDQAFKELTDALEKEEQKTLVLMFGDHQPAINIPGDFVKTGSLALDTRYIVPYILWANYDVEFDAPEITSPNYLSVILKQNAGLPLTAWDRFRLDVMGEYPVITTNAILDKEGNVISQKDVSDSELLTEYQYIQYSRMFQ